MTGPQDRGRWLRRPVLCENCRQPMRQQHESLADWPGTVRFAAKNLCGVCYRSIWGTRRKTPLPIPEPLPAPDHTARLVVLYGPEGYLNETKEPYMPPSFTEPGKHWRQFALCAEVDTYVFYPENGEQRFIPDAKAICAECRVTEQCLAWALENDEREGIWGGHTYPERRRIRREESA